MIILDILKVFGLQVLLILVPLILFGYLIYFCTIRFYRNFGRGANAVVYITGFFGTPIHEMAHALFCVIFGHKITKIKLFQIGVDGSLGYVNHSWDPKNPYQKMGNFFIGIAPMVIIPLFLVLIAFLLLPSMVGEISSIVKSADIAFDVSIFSVFGDMFKAVAGFASDYHFWIFIGVGILFALHMNLSPADIKNASSGVALLLGLMVLIDTILILINSNSVQTLINSAVGISFALCSVLMFALLVSIIAMLFSFLIKIIFRIK